MTHLRAAPLLWLTFAVLWSLWCPPAEAAPDYASFESLYRRAWDISLLTWGLAAVAAIITAAVVIYFPVSAGPVATAIGSWVGGLFGYSGIAATNFGLALLGGGSIAAGGFGIAGGVAVLTAALTFSTDIAFDFGAGTAVERYRYARFVEDSRNMPTLPLPRRATGPDSYIRAMKILESARAKEPLSSPSNQALVKAAIAELSRPLPEPTPTTDRARHDTLLALLHFIADDYTNARSHAQTAYRFARADQMVATMPAFLIATTSLYEDTFDFAKTVEHFRYAIRGEPDNPLTPLLFAVFLDRFVYRMNDGMLSARDLRLIADVADTPTLGESKAPIQVALLTRVVMRLKLEQQKIASLTQSTNPIVRSSPRTVEVVTASLSEYDVLLEAGHFLAGALSTTGSLDQQGVPDELKNIRRLLTSYSEDRGRLRGLVEDFKTIRNENAISSTPSSTARAVESSQILRLLDEAGLLYDIAEDGDISLTYAVNDERQQVVWISGRSETFETLPVRHVWSIAAETSDLPTPAILQIVLNQNSEMLLGAWQLVSDESGHVLVFTAPVVGALNASQLVAVLETVMVVADEMEQVLTNEDEF